MDRHSIHIMPDLRWDPCGKRIGETVDVPNKTGENALGLPHLLLSGLVHNAERIE